VVATFGMARDHALRSGFATAVRLDTRRSRLIVHSDRDTLAVEQLGDIFRVRLTASRDSLTYLPSGLGHGAANLRVTVTRGASSDTVIVSRLGRARRG
jgi:gamma-glutamylcysteine synthetase